MPKKILVVDDDPNARELVRLMLSKYDCEVFEAADGREGFEVAAKEKPHLIIADHLMPQFTGYELLRKVRQDKDMKTMRFIMITSKHFDSDFPELLRLDGCDFISKPFHVAALLGAIEKLIGPLPFRV